jgi:aminoglycoside 6'-N-acetyltransferase
MDYGLQFRADSGLVASMTDDNFVDFKCPHCGETVSFPADAISVLQECPICCESFLIPAAGSAVGRVIPVPIATARLSLRRLAMADWKEVLDILSDEETFRFADGQPQEEADILHWLEADGHIKLTTLGEAYCLGMARQDTGALVGYVTLIFKDHARRQATLGVFVQRSQQKQGFATEAINALLGFCFTDLKLHRVAADCDRRNVAALRVLEKAGLRREGEFLKSHFVHGEWIDTLWYAMLGDEYGQAQAVPPVQ